MKFIYIKGGSAIDSAKRLHYYNGKVPITGPDQFFLSIKEVTKEHGLRVVSINNQNNSWSEENIEAIEYRARVKKKSWFGKMLLYFVFGYQFIKETVRYKPNGIFYNLDGFFVLFVVLAAKISGAKLIYLSHSANNIPQVPKLKRLFNRYLSRVADQVIVHGPFLKQQALSLGVDEGKIVEFDTWSELTKNDFKSSFDTVNKKMIILFIGRIESNKGVWDLINAFESLGEGYNAELWFLGEGSLYPKIKEKVKSLNRGDAIKFLGSVSHDLVFEYIDKSSFIVTPTQTSCAEGRCMSAMEGMALGRSVIAPDFGPFPFLVVNGYNGLLYEPDSYLDLKQKMETLLSNNSLLNQYNKNAKDFARKEGLKQISFYDAIQEVYKKEFL